MSAERRDCGANGLGGFSTTPQQIQKNDLLWSARTPGFPPSWNRIIAVDATTVTFVNGARVTKTWLGSSVTVVRPRVILGGQ